jgi:hypothetical protein
MVSGRSGEERPGRSGEAGGELSAGLRLGLLSPGLGEDAMLVRRSVSQSVK